MRYKMSDVVIEVKERVDNPSESRYERFVGLEHYISGEVVIKKYGSTSKLGSSMKVFHAGDILVARRNVYLKRASVVSFDGLTSGDSIVLRAKNERLRRLLPFVFNTDAFWDFADQFSDGTMSKRLSPKVLMQYEFDLPDEDKQDSLADLLWAAVDVRDAYYNLLEETDALVKSQFVELFGNPIDNPMKWPVETIGDATEDIISGQCLNGDAGTLRPGQKAVLKVSAVTYGYFKEDEYKVLRDPNQITKGVYPQKGDLLFSRANTKEYVGATALVDKDYPDLMLPDKLWKVVFKNYIDPVFAKYFLSNKDVREILSEMATGTSGSMYNISMPKLKSVNIIIPDEKRQLAFKRIVKQSDKSKFELQRAIDNISTVIKTIIQQDFSGGLNKES